MSFRTAAVPKLVRACTETGDERAWREFISRFHGLIAGTVVKTCRQWEPPSPELVDDLIQETYLKVCANNYRVLREFEASQPEAFFGLLKKVAHSVVQDHFRSISAEKRGSGRNTFSLDEGIATPKMRANR